MLKSLGILAALVSGLISMAAFADVNTWSNFPRARDYTCGELNRALDAYGYLRLTTDRLSDALGTPTTFYASSEPVRCHTTVSSWAKWLPGKVNAADGTCVLGFTCKKHPRRQSH
jgi:hypothetical protein